MPYHNMPQSMWANMDKCVSDVQGKGKDKQSAIAICYTSLMKGKELGETMKSFELKAAPHYRATEKASDKASDYLVVEDPKAPSTWHLQVKVDGVPDHRLMGAAWAALHGGYRGNKYEGPNKAEAIAKLKRLYEEEKMPVPSEKAITDAPNLRGDSLQACINCKYATPIITDEAMMVMPMPMDATAMMQAKQSGGIDLICTYPKLEFLTDPNWVCDLWEAIPTPAASDMTGKATDDDAELTDAELWAIDRLYLDVKAGKVTLAPLEETDKAMVNLPHNRPPGGGSPSGGSSSRVGKHEKCYMHLKKLGMDDGEARRVCRVALGGPELKAAAIETGASLTVHKQADGHYRWVAFTSSSYKDRDGEIVSQKALEADTARMDKEKNYGVLDWWHTPIKLGDCDFSAMHGNIRVESGIFDDDFIGEKLSAASKELAASLAFYHPANEPDAEGVYHHIQTFRRALLPRGKESNLLTMLYVSKEEKEMFEDKKKALKKLLGGENEADAKVAEVKVDAILQAADETDKAADGVLERKETDPAPVAPPEAPKDEKPITEQPGMFVADMKPEEFDAHLKEATAKAVTELLAPVLAEVKAQIAAIGEAQATAMKESGATITKQFEAITQAQSALDKRLGELEGLTPRGYRASQDKETAISKEKAETLKPKPDEKQPASLSAWIAEPVEQSPIPA